MLHEPAASYNTKRWNGQYGGVAGGPGGGEVSESGFSLIELLVVLAIVAAVAIIAVPYILSGLPGCSCARRPTTWPRPCRTCTRQAIRERITTELTLDPATRESTAHRAGRPPMRCPRWSPGVGFTTAAIRPDDTVARLRFYADGTSSGGTIRLEHERALRCPSSSIG